MSEAKGSFCAGCVLYPNSVFLGETDPSFRLPQPSLRHGDGVHGCVEYCPHWQPQDWWKTQQTPTEISL